MMTKNLFEYKGKGYKQITNVKYFIENSGHNMYVAKFVSCNVMNFLNVVAQIWIMNVFLNGQFTTYGFDVFSMLAMSNADRYDPMAKVFPKVAKCDFKAKTGIAGNLEKKNAICILGINSFNEKLYVFLWFWFILLLTMTAIHLIQLFVKLSSSKLR